MDIKELFEKLPLMNVDTLFSHLDPVVCEKCEKRVLVALPPARAATVPPAEHFIGDKLHYYVTVFLPPEDSTFGCGCHPCSVVGYDAAFVAVSPAGGPFDAYRVK